MSETKSTQGQLIIPRIILLVANPCSKLEVMALPVPKVFHGVYNSKIGHVTLTTPFSGMICHYRSGTCYD